MPSTTTSSPQIVAEGTATAAAVRQAIGQPADVPILTAGQVVQVPVDMLQRDPNQPRIKFEPEALKALAADIAARGIELPIVVRGDYTIKDGERRWRAAKIAKLETVPCLLASASADVAEGDFAVNWALDQVADNHHREPLNALDWARFLRDLVDVHNIAVKDIPAVLADRGIVYSRSYVSNLIRLVELPEWAKDLINDGRISAAHGKHILTAKDSPAATAMLRKLLKDALENEEREPVTVTAMQNIVQEAFRETHPTLDDPHAKNAPRFDVQTCEQCPSRKEVAAGDWGTSVFCLDTPCYDKKQADADTAKPDTATAPKTASRPKSDAKVAAANRRARQEVAAIKTAKARAVEAIVAKATGTFDRADLLMTIEAVSNWQSITAINERRGWESKRGDWVGDFHRRANALSDDELPGLLIEAVITSSHHHLQEATKRHGIDRKALEKAALDELTTADKKADKKPAKKATAKAVSQ